MIEIAMRWYTCISICLASVPQCIKTCTCIGLLCTTCTILTDCLEVEFNRTTDLSHYSDWWGVFGIRPERLHSGLLKLSCRDYENGSPRVRKLTLKWSCATLAFCFRQDDSWLHFDDWKPSACHNNSGNILEEFSHLVSLMCHISL